MRFGQRKGWLPGGSAAVPRLPLLLSLYGQGQTGREAALFLRSGFLNWRMRSHDISVEALKWPINLVLYKKSGGPENHILNFFLDLSPS